MLAKSLHNNHRVGDSSMRVMMTDLGMVWKDIFQEVKPGLTLHWVKLFRLLVVHCSMWLPKSGTQYNIQGNGHQETSVQKCHSWQQAISIQSLSSELCQVAAKNPATRSTEKCNGNWDSDTVWAWLRAKPHRSTLWNLLTMTHSQQMPMTQPTDANDTAADEKTEDNTQNSEADGGV